MRSTPPTRSTVSGAASSSTRRARARRPGCIEHIEMNHIGLTPLWPAGHLPLKGGDRDGRLLCSFSENLAIRTVAAEGLISPLEGEMAGRPEGGAPNPQKSRALSC